ncbi:class I SAM-dependent DNA methyltransferase [Streptomyces sp. NBC_01190]|uniref:class I SAM-dependent DNA methyltransferase n=1 Tax=Streptomyces sp. NBC_01190 TaxID=2903767 RepID=UPI00386F60E8|nr:class I SAM-dependent methyltransferase [Streptomyces sp. NBC_01190]
MSETTETGSGAGPARDRSGQAAAFDAIGDRYDEAFPHKEGQLAAGEWLLAALPAGAGVLDLGCGTGLPTAAQLSAAGLRVTGVDLSPGMLALARRNVPGARFVEADISDLADLPDLTAPAGPADPTVPADPAAPTDPAAPAGDTFDAVTAFFALLMLPRAEIPVVLRAIHGRLAPGGLLALSMVEADVDDVSIPFLGHTIRVSGYLRDELVEVVTDAGFEVIKEDAYAYAPASVEVPPEEQIFLYCRRA